MIQAIIAGWMIGLVVAIPPGPLSLTLLTYAIKRGFSVALLIALGGMVCEVPYAFLGFTGFRFAEDAGLTQVLRVASCIIIFALGIKHTFGKVSIDVKPVEKLSKDHHNLFFLGLILTGTTPTIAAAYIVLAGMMQSFITFPATVVNNIIAALAAGVGSMTWIVGGLYALTRSRAELNLSFVQTVTRVSGILLLAVGVYNIVDLIRVVWMK